MPGRRSSRTCCGPEGGAGQAAACEGRSWRCVALSDVRVAPRKHASSKPISTHLARPSLLSSHPRPPRLPSPLRTRHDQPNASIYEHCESSSRLLCVCAVGTALIINALLARCLRRKKFSSTLPSSRRRTRPTTTSTSSTRRCVLPPSPPAPVCASCTRAGRQAGAHAHNHATAPASSPSTRS